MWQSLGENTFRLKVSGGWIYRYNAVNNSSSLVFIADPVLFPRAPSPWVKWKENNVWYAGTVMAMFAAGAEQPDTTLVAVSIKIMDHIFGRGVTKRLGSLYFISETEFNSIPGIPNGAV